MAFLAFGAAVVFLSPKFDAFPVPQGAGFSENRTLYSIIRQRSKPPCVRHAKESSGINLPLSPHFAHLARKPPRKSIVTSSLSVSYFGEMVYVNIM
jgi:hypothetical protein